MSELIPFEELQKAIDLFDRIEVTYYDGKPHSNNIELNGVAVLRVREAVPTHRADGLNILHVYTTHFGLTKEPVPLTTHPSVTYNQEQVDKLIAEVRRDTEIEVLDKVVKYNDAMNKEHNYQLIERMKALAHPNPEMEDL